MIYGFWILRKKVVAAVLAGIVAAVAGDNAHAAEAKPGWQAEWERVLAAAKKEGQVTVYISGYEELLPDFHKEYPEIKVQ
ncbi:MAG TPA: hypothetical protein VHM64_23165, partial [Candidatus Binatia bacterium]|nr:hypothetical protein [Candidatus Binatia bacterium]